MMHHHHHHHQQYQSAPQHQPRSGFHHHQHHDFSHQHQPGYAQSTDGSRGYYRGGRGRGTGRNDLPRDFFFLVLYPDFQSVRNLQNSVDPFFNLSEPTRMKINQLSKGFTTGGSANVLLLVNRKYLAGCMTYPASPDGSPMVTTLDASLAEKYANLEFAVTDQGDWITETPHEVNTLSKQYFQCLKQVFTDAVVLQNYDKTTHQSDSRAILELPFVDVLTKLEKDPSMITAFEMRVDVASGVKSPTTQSPSETEDSHEFIVRVIQHTGTLLTSTVWLTVMSKLLASTRYRPLVFDRLNTLTEEFAKSSGDLTNTNVLESQGYILFKSLFCHVLSAKLVLSTFTLRDTVEQVASESTTKEQDILCRCISAYGFEAACANLGGGTLSAIVKSCMATVRASDSSRKRTREDHDSSETNTMVTASPRLSSEPERLKLLAAISEAFTAGLNLNDASADTNLLFDRNSPQMTFEVRVLGMARHVAGCRAVQFCIPFFLQSFTNDLEQTLPNIHRRILSFIASLARQVGVLSSDMYGNYVVQTLLEELVRFIDLADVNSGALLRKLFHQTVDTMVSVLTIIGTNKCASNCLEKLIGATGSLHPISLRATTLLDIVRAFAGDHDKLQNVFLTLAVHPFGNYVVKQLLHRLTYFVRDTQQNVTEADDLTQRLVGELKVLEKNIFAFVRNAIPVLQQSNYSQATMVWAQHQIGRLAGGF